MSQSHASQFSDNYPSSIFEDHPVEALSFLTSDGPFNLDGGETPISTPSVTFTRPTVPILIPQTLERVGPCGRKKYILWTEMFNEEFVAWWLKTEYGSTTKRNIFEGKQQAGSWEHFHQVATISDGSPKVMSATCQKRKSKTHDIRKMISNGANLPSRKKFFAPGAWMDRLTTFIVASRLLFQLVEYPEFRALIEMASSAPTIPEIPSARTIRRHLQEIVRER
ncbi:hypothetical protein N7523_001140 [Penicillium sp. IBT 18751x]|nr:hypothetical protein N7523_001140 [Penicillium sp. IBT 18751x]